jgi:hypothetical protein
MRRRGTTPEDEAEALEYIFPQGPFVPSVYAPIVTPSELTEEVRLAFAPRGWPLSGVVGCYFNLELQGEVAGNLISGAGVGYTKAALATDAPSLDCVAGQQLETVPHGNGNASAKYALQRSF